MKSSPTKRSHAPQPRRLKSRSALSTPANVPVELTFTTQRSYADPFNDVVLDAVFTDPAGHELRVPAFWAGGRTWKIRYASPHVGEHRYTTVSSDPADAGLHGLTGSVTVSPYRGSNPLYRHGPIQVSGDKRHFQHHDGTPFFWLGDTWWMGLCWRLQWPQGFKKLTADRKKKGFNLVQIIAGLYPDMYAFDPRGANEAGHPWEEGYSHIRPEYFDKADERLGHLVEQGLVPCIVGAWGYFISWMTEDQLKAHWRYLIARYSAWPVVWCTGGEANLPWYLAKNFPEDDRTMVKGWTHIMRHLRENDPFHRPITIHPTAIKRYTSRNATDDETLLDFDLMQCYHAQNEGVSMIVPAVRETYAATPRMPVINGEPPYENLGGSLTTPWIRRAFWSCVLNGAAGHTYGGNGIWQVNRPGEPHGASPHGGNYGITPWEDAMNYAGSMHCAIGKKFITQFDWTKFTPHPEWAAYTGNPWLPLTGAKWIWSADENPAKDAPNKRKYFRKTFELPAGQKVANARLRFAGTVHVEAQLNGSPAGVGWEWRTGPQFNDLGSLIKSGKNVLTIWCEHRPATGDKPGLLAVLEVTLTNGKKLLLKTDASWKVMGGKMSGWEQIPYDDSATPKALVLAALGDAPWGAIGELDLSVHGPQVAGIEDKVRVIYAPHPESIVVRQLQAGKTYTTSHFNPVSGKSGKKFAVKASRQGEVKLEPPAGETHDWVVSLEG